MSYAIYIIDEKRKVGLAKNLDDRLAQQGYVRGEVTIFQEGIESLETARMVEKTLQTMLGYDAHEQGEDLVDIAIKNKKMKKFKTFEGNTIGFPNQLEYIMDLVGDGCELETNKGSYKASADDIKTLHKDGHFRKSKFSGGNLQTYIYTKVVDNYFESKPKEDVKCNSKSPCLNDLIANIHDWADNRGILDGSIETQTLKLGEEFGELQKAVLKSRPEEIKDAIGDIIVVLVSIAHFNGHSVAEAVDMAYGTISKRTGYTNDKGDFIKTHYDGKEIKTTL